MAAGHRGRAQRHAAVENAMDVMKDSVDGDDPIPAVEHAKYAQHQWMESDLKWTPIGNGIHWGKSDED